MEEISTERQGETVGVQEAGRILMCSPDTVRMLIRSRQIPATKIGRPWVMLRRDLHRFLQNKIDTEHESAQKMAVVNREYLRLIQ